MPDLNYVTLDVFATTRYTGNPLAIITVPWSTNLTQAQKQSIASEFNLSEIVILHLPQFPSKTRTIDIFTSQNEVPFAGHPTVGTSWYLLKVLNEEVDTLITKAGPIPISYDNETGVVKAQIPFNYHLHAHTTLCPLTSSTPHPVASIVNGMSFIFVQLPTLEDLGKVESLGNVGNLSPDTWDTSILDEGWRTGLVGTMYFVVQGEDEFRRKKYRTRMFGTKENPGTESANSGLGCLLSERERNSGVFRYAFKQEVEMGRKNENSVEVTRGEKGIEGVVLKGKAAQVMNERLDI